MIANIGAIDWAIEAEFSAGHLFHQVIHQMYIYSVIHLFAHYW
jgi:hypothetical protein